MKGNGEEVGMGYCLQNIYFSQPLRKYFSCCKDMSALEIVLKGVMLIGITRVIP
jgi:hypothetical protein